MSLFLSSLLLAGAALGAPVQPSDSVFTNATITLAHQRHYPFSLFSPGIVSNCDEYYFVKPGDICIDIASAKGITLYDFSTWNPQAGETLHQPARRHLRLCVRSRTYPHAYQALKRNRVHRGLFRKAWWTTATSSILSESGESCPAIQKELWSAAWRILP
ncbi:unnamed protein product, partial [Alternaria alternata]